jgi:hypothetical protein
LIDISLFFQRLIKIEINLFLNRFRITVKKILPERCWQWNMVCTIRHFAFAPAALAASALAVADFAATTLAVATTFATSTLAVSLALALLALTLTAALLARFEETLAPD